jgi:hypothetical protein
MKSRPRLPQARRPSLCRSRRPWPHPHPRRPETSQNLPSRSPHPQSPLHLGHRQARPLQVPGTRSAPWTPITWSCALEKCVPASASAISRSNPKKPARWNAAYHERIHLRPIQSHPARVRRPSSKRLSNSWPATATYKKAWAWMALTGRRPAEIFFSASFSLPREKLPYPALLFDGQLENLAKLPVPAPSLTSSSVLGDPKKLVQALDTLRTSKASLPHRPSTPPPAHNSPSTFPPPSAPSTYPGNQVTSAQPTAPSVATCSNPKHHRRYLPRPNPRS